jgi:hypothetical protein
MNLLLGFDSLGGNKFDNYQFVINRTPGANGKTSVEKSTGGYAFQSAGSVSYTVSGNHIAFSVPKSVLGINGKFTMKIKAADNVTNPGDIMDYYVTGDSAPIGRLSYTYYGGA